MSNRAAANTTGVANHSSTVCGEKPRLEQHELAIARDDEVHDLLIAVAGFQPLAHQQPQILGQGRVGIVDRLVLADEAAQAFGDGPGARLQRGIRQHLVGLHRMRGHQRKEAERKGQEKCRERLARLQFAPDAAE